MFDSFFRWVESSDVSIWINQSPSLFAFPGILAAHTPGLGLLAGLNSALDLRLFRRVGSLGPGAQPPALARLSGGFSLVLWITVIVCGRMITFYRPTLCQPGDALGLVADCIVRSFR